MYFLMITDFQQSSLPTKYLGAPLVENALHNISWEHLLATMESKVLSWTFRTLNLPTCLLHINSVLWSMPLYLFYVLVAPKLVLKYI